MSHLSQIVSPAPRRQPPVSDSRKSFVIWHLSSVIGHRSPAVAVECVCLTCLKVSRERSCLLTRPRKNSQRLAQTFQTTRSLFVGCAASSGVADVAPGLHSVRAIRDRINSRLVDLFKRADETGREGRMRGFCPGLFEIPSYGWEIPGKVLVLHSIRYPSLPSSIQRSHSLATSWQASCPLDPQRCATPSIIAEDRPARRTRRRDPPEPAPLRIIASRLPDCALLEGKRARP
jgi:hypothetical protein